MAAGRVRENERRAAAARPTFAWSPDEEIDDLAALLHEEIDRLPERYRVPVVLCDLQGLTHERTARHPGWPVGTVKTRLARAREMLRGRLSRRGLGMPAGLLPSRELFRAFPVQGFESALPGRLVDSTVRAAAPVAAGKSLAAGVISSHVAFLIAEVQKTMVVTKLKAAAVVALIGAVGAAGVLAQATQRSNANQGDQPAQGSPSAGSRRDPTIDDANSPAPAYIRQSRALILTRLEQEVAEAQARLDRTVRKFKSPDDPAVIRARETLEALTQRLDRIDRVLVDVVETYPTMVDFSSGPDEDGRRDLEQANATAGQMKDGRWSILPSLDRGNSTQKNRRSVMQDGDRWFVQPLDQSNSPQTKQPDKQQGQNGGPQPRDTQQQPEKNKQPQQGEKAGGQAPNSQQKSGEKPSNSSNGAPNDQQKPGEKPTNSKQQDPNRQQKAGEKPSDSSNGAPNDQQKPGEQPSKSKAQAPNGQQ